MENTQEEYYFSCPYCWKFISFLLDLSAGQQTYVEDCENCCHPISVTYQVEGGELSQFEASKAQ
jgi:hypothetical protein